jgi:hypothetical protein
MVSALEIAQEIGNDHTLKRKSKVVAFEDLPGVPEGTRGRIALVGGWDKWIRYHVLFDNGVVLSSINRESLVPAKEYETFNTLRTRALESGVFDRAATAEAAGADGGGGGGDASSDSPVVNGVTIPAYLIERSKAARERLGA